MRDEYEVIYETAEDRILRRMRTDIYRLTVRKEEDGDEGTAGVREPLRPKPLIPAAALALEVS
jgi:hypothetical protein